MADHLVSVIIPVYNGERFLRAAIESVLAQDYQSVEIIVVDDGSTDGTAAIARSFPDVRYLYQSNEGPAAARNTGVAAAKGELLAFMDADDLWPPRKLSEQAGYLLDHPEIGYTIALVQNFVQEGLERPRWLPKAAMEAGAIYGTGTLVVRAEVFRRIGPFNPAFRVAEDTDWFIRAEDAGVGKAVLPEVLLYRRIHDRNLSAAWQEGSKVLLRSLKASIDRKRAAALAPLVSVIIPVFNGERYLAAAIQSALDQTYRPIEIVVVDDGSADGSAAVARSFGPPVTCLCVSHAGLGAVRNAGVDAARGHILAFLDADDLWHPDKIALQTAAFAREPATDMVFTHIRHFLSPELDEERKRRLVCPSGSAPGYLASTVAVRRDAFQRVGPFRTDLRVGEFIDWYARAKEQGLSHVLLSEVLVERRVHGANMSLCDRSSQLDYVRLLKQSIDRRRGQRKEGEYGQ